MAASRRTSRRTPEKAREDWLEQFEKLGTVMRACKAAKVGRSTVYEWKQKFEEFALGWADIEEATTEAMEREAYRRAVEGTVKPLVSAGKHVTNVTEYSDTLLIFMLKSRRPERYRDNFKVEYSGRIEHSVTELEGMSDADLLKRLADS